MLISIPDSALYPDSRFQSDSGLSQGGTDCGLIPTVVYILTVVSSLCDYSSQHSPHSLAISFHVIFISAYPAVQVKLAYVNMPGRNDLIQINLLYLPKESRRCKPATTRREETNARTTRMTALVKGFVSYKITC